MVQKSLTPWLIRAIWRLSPQTMGFDIDTATLTRKGAMNFPCVPKGALKFFGQLEDNTGSLRRFSFLTKDAGVWLKWLVNTGAQVQGGIQCTLYYWTVYTVQSFSVHSIAVHCTITARMFLPKSNSEHLSTPGAEVLRTPAQKYLSPHWYWK